MTARDLEIFVCAAECGQMSEAARRLMITQSSVSQSIAGIEQEYGVLLFERRSKRIFLTDTGRSLLRYARSALSLHKEIESVLRSESISPYLKIGATVTVGTCVLSPIILSLERRLPGIQTEVLVANTHILEEMLLKGELDVGLVEGTVSSQELISTSAIRDDLVLVCAPTHKFCGRKTIDAHELSSEKLILRETGSGTRAQLEEQLKQKGIGFHVAWNCYNSEAIKNAVMDGHGISVISKRLVQKDVDAGKLWMCGIRDLTLERRFRLVYHRNKFRSEAFEAFAEICMEFGQQHRDD